MQRHLLGVCALILLATGAVLFATYYPPSGSLGMFVGACVRVGLLLAATWLAWPQLVRLFARVSPLALLGVLIALALLAWRPRLFIVIGPILVLLAVLQLFGWFTKPASQNSSFRDERTRGGKTPRRRR